MIRTMMILTALLTTMMVAHVAWEHGAELTHVYVGGDGGEGGPGGDGVAGPWDCELKCEKDCRIWACTWAGKSADGIWYCSKSTNNFPKQCVQRAGPFESCETVPADGPCTNFYKDPCLRDSTHPIPVCGSTIVNGCGSKTKCST